MWEAENGARKQHSAASRSKLVNHYDQTDDLHAWSIYRQNLNADLSECAIGINKSANTERPFGSFQLKESTVNNILQHPKYGPRLKQDPYTYLKFGLPRAKAHLNNQQPLHSSSNRHQSSSSNLVLNHSNHHRLNYDSNETKHLRKSNSRHSLSSNEVEISSLNADHNIDQVDRSNHHGTSQNTEHSINKMNGNKSFNGRSAGVGQEHRSEKRTSQNKYSQSNGINRSHHSPKSRTNLIDERDSPNPLHHTNRHQIHEHSFSNQPNNHHYMANHSFVDNGPANASNQPKFPHLIVRNLYFELDRTSNSRRVCGAQRQKIRIIDNVSFEVRAGEMLAILATSEIEGTSILNVLANRHNKTRSRMKGDLIYNGVFLTPAKLGACLAYVGQDLELCPKMSTRQTILFATLLRSPAHKRTFDTKKRLDSTIQELGLSEVRHSSVADLTEPEKRRLMIAMNLMLDTDLLLLDQPTKEMDIFDTFFLIEYLRQWVVVSGRCVILTIQPSTYEIFTMLSKIALISTGRTLYFGPRREMLNYFSSIDFPCPTYKNPADYYLDLVTLDNLSTEAAIESSERIETLADLYNNHGTQQGLNSGFVPPAPSFIAGAVKKQNFAIVFLALWIRSLIFTFPYNVIYMFRNVCLALLLSLLTGSIFYHVRLGREQEWVWDRIMFYHCLLAIMPVPLYLILMNDVYKEKQYVLNEIKIGLYSKGCYFASNFVYTLPSSTLILLAYALPASSMAAQKHNLIFYIAIMLGYLHTMRILALTMAWGFRKRANAICCFAFMYTFIIFTAGTSIHHKDLTIGISRSLIFTFPYNVIYMFRNVCLALLLSLLTGSIFYHVRLGREQEWVWDRIMFYHCLLAIMPVPLYLILMNDVYKEKQYVLNEIKIGLYSKGCYFASNFVYTLPSSTLILLAYALPASSMAAQKHNLIFYIAIMLGYLHTMRILALTMAWGFRKRANAICCFAFMYTFIIFTAGTSIHHKDLTIGIRLFQYASPYKYAHLALINWEFNVKDTLTRYLCSNNPIIQQENAILIKADCGFELKEHMLIWFNYLGKIPNSGTYFLAFGLISIVFIIFNLVAFCLFSRRKNSNNDSNKSIRPSYK